MTQDDNDAKRRIKAQAKVLTGIERVGEGLAKRIIKALAKHEHATLRVDADAVLGREVPAEALETFHEAVSLGFDREVAAEQVASQHEHVDASDVLAATSDDASTAESTETDQPAIPEEAVEKTQRHVEKLGFDVDTIARRIAPEYDCDADTLAQATRDAMGVDANDDASEVNAGDTIDAPEGVFDREAESIADLPKDAARGEIVAIHEVPDFANASSPAYVLSAGNREWVAKNGNVRVYNGSPSDEESGATYGRSRGVEHYPTIEA